MTKRTLLIVVLVFHHAVAHSFFSDSTSIECKQLLKAGLAYQNEGKIERALQSYFSALRLTSNAQYGWDAAMVSQRIAGLYEQYYRYEESLNYLKTTHRYFLVADSILPLAKLSNNVAWHFIKLHQMDSALKYAEQSIQSFRRLDKPPTMAYCIALESLGEIYSFKGKDDLAQATLKECLDLGLRSKNEVIVGFASYGLALNEFNHSRYATAQAYISRCIPIADRHATGALLADVYRLAFQIYDSSHQPTVAYRYLKVYQQLRDSLYTQDVEKKAAIVNANYEIQKKESELKALAQNNAIQKLELDQQILMRNVGIGALASVVLISLLVYSRIQSKRRFEKQEYDRKKEELKQARLMQLSLLPQKPFQENGITIVGKMQTATEVGGDYFDYFKLDDHRVLIAFGDATGHGTTAGMIVTVTKVVIVNNLKQIRDSNNLLPMINAINEALIQTLAARGKGMSLQLAILDTAAQTVSITSCGMPYPLIYHSELNTFHVMELRQPPLGFLKQTLARVHSISFTSAHTLILVSDGILERYNAQKEEYGLDRLLLHLQNSLQSGNLSLTGLLENTFAQNDLFASGIANHDDMTCLCLRVTS